MRRFASLLIPAGLALAAPAHADRGEITEQTPYTLEPAEVRVGLSDVSVGLFGHDLLRRMEVGTRPIAWFPNLVGLSSYDVRAKFELWRDPVLSIGVAAEHLRVDFSNWMDDSPADEGHFLITPLEGWVGARLGRVRVNGGLVYTAVSAHGNASTDTIDELGAAAGTSSAQIRANVDIAVSPAVHLIAGGRYTPWQQQWGEASGSEHVGEGGDGPEGDVSNTTRGEGDLMNVGGKAWSTSAEVHLTLEHFNLRLGVEYGYYTIPIVNFVVSEKGFMPVADLYWRI